MLGVQGWLACPGCGAWGGRDALCPRCGAVRGGRVPLDQSPGDGSWVFAARGDVGEVLRSLELRPGVEGDVVERVGVARRVIEAAPAADAPLSLWLDLRPPEAGHVARRTRNANVQDTVFVLPWLLLRQGGREARVVRTVHQRVKKGFVRGGAQSTTTARLDELVVLGPDGSLRRPVSRLDRLTGVDWSGVDPDTPEPAPLPPTAPGQPGAGGRAPVLTGLLAAAVLLWLCPVLVRPFTPRDPAGAEAARTRALAGLLVAEDGPAPDRVEQVVAFGSDARDAVRAALQRGEPWTRAQALVAATSVLERQERLRALVGAARGRDVPGEVRAVAIELLGREGDLGATHLARLITAAELEASARSQALLVLLDHDRARAGAEALHLLEGFPPVTPLRRACLQVLGAPGAVSPAARGRALERLEAAVLEDPEPACRARAAWSLANVARGAPAAQARFLHLFAWTLGLSPPSAPADVARQAQLARALVRLDLPGAFFDAVLQHPGLAAPAREALRRGRDERLRR